MQPEKLQGASAPECVLSGAWGEGAPHPPRSPAPSPCSHPCHWGAWGLPICSGSHISWQRPASLLGRPGRLACPDGGLCTQQRAGEGPRQVASSPDGSDLLWCLIKRSFQFPAFQAKDLTHSRKHGCLDTFPINHSSASPKGPREQSCSIG